MSWFILRDKNLAKPAKKPYINYTIVKYTPNMKNRALISRLESLQTRSRGRLVTVTGARQTGKTTLVKKAFPDYMYLSMEDPVLRTGFGGHTAEDWYAKFPKAIVDEVQKFPQLIETIQTVYDAHEDSRYVLLGSSQIELLRKVRESLAGRAAIVRLFPLTLPELATSSWDDPVSESVFIRFLRGLDPGIFKGEPLADPQFTARKLAFGQYLTIGAMPALHKGDFTPQECREWLGDYNSTYLQRDLSDLSRIDNLEPFVKLQRALASRSGGRVNYSDLARAVSVSPDTARRFVRYLELSYQVVVLEAYYRNPEKRLSKAPKIHFLDPGVQRGISGNWDALSGMMFESAVIAEIYKQCANVSHEITTHCYHLHTPDGREVDLLIELEAGFVVIECKLTEKPARGFQAPSEPRNDPWEKGARGDCPFERSRCPPVRRCDDCHARGMGAGIGKECFTSYQNGGRRSSVYNHR